MPWCPICAQEYEESVARCAECGAKLVPEPPPPDYPEKPNASEELIRSRDPELLARAVKYLASLDVPAQVAAVPPEEGVQGGFALTVPALAWERAASAVAPFLDAPPVADQPDLRKFVPESLNLSLKEIIDRGQDLLGDLAKALLVGDGPVQVKAGYALVEMGEPARQFLVEMLQDAVQADDTWRVRRICQPLSKFRDPEALCTVLDMTDRREHLVTAVAALGQLQDPGAVPRLVQLLEDKDASVRDEAAESLYNITGKSFDFEAEDPPELREEAVEQWHRWMHRRGMV